MRKCKRTKKKKICVIVLAAVIITAGWKIHSVAPILHFSPEYEEGASSRTAVLPEGSVDLKDLYSPYAVLVDVESGNVLAGQKAEKKIYPASLTKIMTAVVASKIQMTWRIRQWFRPIYFPRCMKRTLLWRVLHRERQSPGKICFMVSCFRPERNVV